MDRNGQIIREASSPWSPAGSPQPPVGLMPETNVARSSPLPITREGSAVNTTDLWHVQKVNDGTTGLFDADSGLGNVTFGTNSLKPAVLPSLFTQRDSADITDLVLASPLSFANTLLTHF